MACLKKNRHSLPLMVLLKVVNVSSSMCVEVSSPLFLSTSLRKRNYEDLHKQQCKIVLPVFRAASLQKSSTHFLRTTFSLATFEVSPVMFPFRSCDLQIGQ